MALATTNVPGATLAPEPALARPLRHVVGLAAVAGCVEVVGYLDCSGIYPGIMTGNTVQLGLTSATAQWTRFALIAFAVGSFFVGGILASVIRRRLRRPPLELLIMAAVLVAASLVRREIGWRIPFELPLLAIAMALQGEAISKFGGISIQTIVVTNNMVKFTDAIVGRYVTWRNGTSPRVAVADVVLPGLAWVCYSIAAGAAALLSMHFAYPLLIPAVLLMLLSWDLLHATALPLPAIA